MGVIRIHLWVIYFFKHFFVCFSFLRWVWIPLQVRGWWSFFHYSFLSSSKVQSNKNGLLTNCNCSPRFPLTVAVVLLFTHTGGILHQIFFFRFIIVQINTLYVGNLPTSPIPSGISPSFLEDSLRTLFARCQGFKRLCFRQKHNGPMCFVEVCVHYSFGPLLIDVADVVFCCGFSSRM